VHPLHGALGLAQAEAEVLVNAVGLIRLSLSGVGDCVDPTFPIAGNRHRVFRNGSPQRRRIETLMTSWQFPSVGPHGRAH